MLAAGVAIELLFDGGFVRYTVGDIVIAAFIFWVIRAVAGLGVLRSAMVAIVITYGVELAQAARMLERLSIPRNRLTELVFGTTFTWGDLVAYTIGIAIAAAMDNVADRR